VLLFWGAYIVILARDPLLLIINVDMIFEYSINRGLQKIPLLGVSPQSWAIRNFKFTLMLLLFVSRVLSFVILEYPRLEAVAERVRYERCANSFDYVAVSQLSEQNTNRLNLEPSYQFTRLWLLGIPVYWIVAPWPLKWVPGFDRIHPPFNQELPRLLGIGVLWEIVGRIVVETIWRCFRLDLNENGSALEFHTSQCSAKGIWHRQLRVPGNVWRSLWRTVNVRVWPVLWQKIKP